MTKRPIAKPYHHGDLRAALIKLAGEQIAASGVQSVSVRALATEAGVAHRAAYQHFPDKDGLVAAVLAAAYERLAMRMEKAARKAAAPEEKLLAAALAYADFAFAEPNMFLAMSGPRINEAGEHKDLEASLSKAWRHIAGPVGVAVESGVFTVEDRRTAAAIFWGGLQGVLSQAILNRLKLKASERKAFMRRAAERLIAGLKA